VPAAGLEYYVRPGRAFGVIPTNDGLVCIPTARTHGEFARYRRYGATGGVVRAQ
jgi:hypothetical protein